MRTRERGAVVDPGRRWRLLLDTRSLRTADGLGGVGEAAACATFLALTSLRFLTVYPSGRVPSLSIRSGQRPHLGLSLQHFFFGPFGTAGD